MAEADFTDGKDDSSNNGDGSSKDGKDSRSGR
jgi:hypothetical protein